MAGSDFTDADLINWRYPVGSIYLSSSSTSPATLFGVGTWSAWGAGRCIAGQETGIFGFATAESTGGNKTETLDATQIPNHNHSVTDPGHSHQFGYVDDFRGPEVGSTDFIDDYPSSGTETSSSATTGVSIQSAGGGGAHNNMNPYIVVYAWKRTA